VKLFTRSKVLFSLSGLSFIWFLIVFQSELSNPDVVCSADLVTKKESICLINRMDSERFRATVSYGGSRKTSQEKVTIKLLLTEGSTENWSLVLNPRAASYSGQTKRYYGTLNYGTFNKEFPKGVTLTIRASENVSLFRKFEVRVLRNPNGAKVYLWAVITLILLFLSIWFRTSIFVKGIGRPLPYLLFFFVSFILLAWEL
jgi:hypothetical protein